MITIFENFNLPNIAFVVDVVDTTNEDRLKFVEKFHMFNYFEDQKDDILDNPIGVRRGRKVRQIIVVIRKSYDKIYVDFNTVTTPNWFCGTYDELKRFGPTLQLKDLLDLNVDEIFKLVKIEEEKARENFELQDNIKKYNL